MTLPNERLRAMKRVKEFCSVLLDPKRRPKRISELRMMIRGVTKHYPSDYELDEMAEKCPELLESDE